MCFSIIITTYHAEKFLLDALNSLKNQSFQDFEWIITDDCSTDKTLEICKKWLSENPEILSRCKIIESSVNTGVSANVNRGLKAASSEWIYVLSGDDALLENTLEKVRNFIEKNPNITIFQGVAAIYQNDFSANNFIENSSENYAASDFFNCSAQTQYRRLLKRCNVVAPAVFYKKQIVEEVGFCDENIRGIDDWPLWLKLTKNGHKIHFYNEVLVQYRQHHHSIVNENKGLFVTGLHRKERLVYRRYIAPNIGFRQKIKYHLGYVSDEILYRFFNSEKNRFAVFTLNFLRFFKHLFCPKKIPKNPKHVAIFMQDFEMNGVGIVFLNYVKILKSLGYTLTVIVARDRGSLHEVLKDKAQLINLGNIRLRHAIFKLRKQLKNSSVSTLVSGSELPNFIAVLATFGLKKSGKLVVTQHAVSDQDVSDLGFKGQLMKLAKCTLYRYASRIVAVSQAVADDLRKQHLPSKKITILPNPVFPEEIVRLSKKPVSVSIPERYVLFIGRLANVKNVDLLMDAFAKINDENLHLLIIGDGPNRQRLEQKAQFLQARIHFLGVVENPMPFIKHAEIIAVPSLSESVSLVTLEACVLGKTVVHTPTTGCIDVLGKTGGYCSQTFNDPTDFANALQKALENPVESTILRHCIQRFEAQNIAPLLGKLVNRS